MSLKKILVIMADSNKERLHQLAVSLAPDRFTVMEATDGRSALDLAGSYKADIVVTALGVDFVDGFNVCKYIKHDPLTKDIAVVVFARQSDVGSVMEALKAGADDYLIEPFETDVFRRKIDKVVRDACRLTVPGENRDSVRKPARLTVTWTDRKSDRFEVTFKELVIDLSESGMAFEHFRCHVCTGYLEGSVHPQCPFFSNYLGFKGSRPLQFYVTFEDNKIIAAEGKIVYVHQSDKSPLTERVGVKFTKISKDVRALIREYVYEKV